MPRAHRSAVTLGEWAVSFDPRAARLVCRHRTTRARVAGQLEFLSPRGEKMPIAADPTDSQRLTIRDARGDCQMYVRLNAAGCELTLTLVPRGRTTSHGQLAFRGQASLGRHTFACRTFAPQEIDVVQMASGPADSGLNDSLFDVAQDAALRFRAGRVSLRIEATAEGERQSFGLVLEGRIDHAAETEVAIRAERHFYRDRYVPWYRPLDKQRLPSPPTGWMSWNTYFDQAGEAENLDEARLGAKYLKPYGLQIWSIESWQDNSPSLPVSRFHHLTLRPYAKQFPHGMEWLAKQIRRLGFVPGIWTVPFGTGDAGFYREHKGWFLHHADGRPMSNWCGDYVLDPSQPAVRRHLTESHRRMAEWGYDFFKIDGMSGGSRHYSAHFFEAPEVQAAFRQPCADPFARCTRALREGIGPERTLLACGGHYSGPEVAACDAARIGGDVVSPNQPVTWHSYLEQASMILSCLFVHGLVWYCDPDTLLVGTAVPLAQAQVAATAIAMAGQVMFAGDKLGELPPERRWLLQRCLPVCDVHPLDLYPLHRLAPIWDLKVRRPFGQWDVVSIFNFGDTAKRVTIEMAHLGLGAEKSYLIYDFWQSRLLGRRVGHLSLEVAPRANRLLAVHEDLGRPQFLSSDRHLTQGAVAMPSLSWDEAHLALYGEVELVGSEQTRLTCFVPSGYRLREMKATRAKISRVDADSEGVLTVALDSARNVTAGWRLRFEQVDVR